MASSSHLQKRFRELVKDHGDKIFNLALMRSNNMNLAQDISQETFLRAYKGISKFRNEAEISTWLYRIALNVCHTTLIKESNRSQLNAELTPELMEGFGDEGSVEADYLKAIQKEEIRKAISNLPNDQGDAITLYYLKEFQYSEVAEIMSIPLNTVKSHIRRAKINLRKMIEEEQFL